MPRAFGPRFAIEAVFLVVLAVGVGVAGLSTPLIVLVMAAAWLLVALVEWLVSNAEHEHVPPLVPDRYAWEEPPGAPWDLPREPVPDPAYPVRPEAFEPPDALTTVLRDDEERVRRGDDD